MDSYAELVRIANIFYLAFVIWREARGESPDARAGVAFTVLFRAAHPGWWGVDIPSVVTKKWQFSSMTDPRDPQLTTWPVMTDSAWLECLQLARGAVDGTVQNPAPGADSYYDISIPAPKWATPATFVVQLGRIKFHRARDVKAT